MENNQSTSHSIAQDVTDGFVVLIFQTKPFFKQNQLFCFQIGGNKIL